MPAAPVPPAFERLGGRRFAFHPPIRGSRVNEWTFRHATWSEVLVRNTRSGEDVSVPRRFLGEASRLDDPVVVIRLLHDLEYRDGFVLPARPRVIEMPTHAFLRTQRERCEPAKVVGIRLEPRQESRAAKVVGAAVALGVLGCLAFVGYSWQGARAEPVVSLGHTYLVLTASDDAASVLRALGRPARERRTSAAGQTVHVLDYPRRSFRAVLMENGAGQERYIGSLGMDGRVAHSVLLPSGETSARILDQLGEYFAQ